MKINHLCRAGTTPCTLLLTATVLLMASVVGAQSPDVIASGLSNPRGLAFAPNGDLYVVEAGSGAPNTVTSGPPDLVALA